MDNSKQPPLLAGAAGAPARRRALASGASCVVLMLGLYDGTAAYDGAAFVDLRASGAAAAQEWKVCLARSRFCVRQVWRVSGAAAAHKWRVSPSMLSAL